MVNYSDAKSLVLSCCDVNKEHGGTTNVLLGYWYVHSGCMPLYKWPTAFPMVSVWYYRENLKSEQNSHILINEQINKFIYFYVY